MWSEWYNVMTLVEIKWRTQGVIENFGIIKWHNECVLTSICKLYNIEFYCCNLIWVGSSHSL